MTQKRKYTKKSDYWSNARKSTPIEKAGNTDMAVSRLKIGEIGSTALSSIKVYTDWIKDYDLVWPKCVKTFSEMARDDAVSTALEANYLFVERAFDTFTVSFNKESTQSEKAAEFVDWCLKNMDGQTLREAVRSALTCKVYGFSVLEKVYTQVKTGEYIGYYKVQKLASRPAETLDPLEPFKFSEDGREVLSVVQNITKQSGFPGQPLLISTTGKVEIPRNKFLLFSYSSTDTNPFGISPLESVYIPWKEKKLISEYETVGVAKDMGGMPVLEVPADILNRAAENPGGDEYQSIETLKENMANMHAGEQAYMILPSDPHEQSQSKQYSISFKGIEGSGKQFDTAALKEERKKSIYDRFGAGFLIMGNTESGSYSLSDNKQTLHSQFIERDVKLFSEVMNKDLIPQLLALNGIKLSEKDMPVFIPGEVGDPDIEGNSKMLQRVISVGALPMTAEVINEILRKCGFTYRIPEEILTDENKFQDFVGKFLPTMTSRSGDGMETGTTGNGTAKTVTGKDSSSLNTENAA